MPIKVTCQCGKSFAAKDELAGKAVKCPNCQQPLRIPGGSPAAVKAPAKPAAQPALAAAAAPAKLAAAGQRGGDDLFAEVGLKQQALNTRPCPGCTAPLAPDAVICVKCGYNTKLGRRMETIKVGSSGGPEGHGAVAQALLDKAAEAIEEQKDEDRKKTAEGVPVYVYAIALAAVIGFCVMMSFIPQGMGMAIAGLVVIVLSLVLNFYAWIRGLIEAFMQNPLIGLGIFFGDIAITIGMIALIVLNVPYVGLVTRYAGFPILWTIFVVANWETCGIYMNMIWFSVIMRWIGLFMLLMGAWMAIANKDDPDAAAPRQLPPPAVAAFDAENFLVAELARVRTTSEQPNSGEFGYEGEYAMRKADWDANESSFRNADIELAPLDRRLVAGRRSDGAFHLAG